MQHDWIKSTLGHGETMCRRCFVTNREAAAIGMHECGAPPYKPQEDQQMAEYPIDLQSSCRQERDGSLTVMVTISGLPDVDAANKVSKWMRDIVRENADRIGRREARNFQQ